MTNNNPLIIPNKHLLAMGTSSIFTLYGSIKLMALAYNFLAYTLGVGGFISFFASIPFLAVGGVLGFGLFVQACKYLKLWPMDLSANDIFGAHFSTMPKTWKDKVVEFTSVFLNDCKTALRTFDRSLLEHLSHFVVSENSPEYKRWTSANKVVESEDQGWFVRSVLGPFQSANQAIKKFIQTQGIPAVAQGIICKVIHKQSVQFWHASTISRMKYKHEITESDLDAESTQAAILTMYNYSLSRKGLVETVATAVYAEYQNPPKTPVVGVRCS
tara:strand:- start:23693 stop:24508 length:816 start_codon:yes stop_codon:yes gene_type:complete